MTARRHHYVPQCYLRGFVAEREKPELFVINTEKRQSFLAAPANVATKRDFNRIDVDGHPPDALENAFSGFETKLDRALRQIVSARSIKSEKDRVMLFNLIGLMATKNPRLRENFRVFREHIERVFMDLVTSTPELWASHVRRAQKDGYLAASTDTDYEKMRKFVERSEFRVETTTSQHLHMELRTFDKILPLIFRRKWVLFRASPKSSGFVTSDHPMCLMWSDLALSGGFPPGLGRHKTQLLFPISNDLAMIGTFEGDHDDDDEIDADDLLVAQINGSIILHSMRQIYARDSEFLYMFQHNSSVMRGATLLDDQCFSRPFD
ncbi:hypothetical protein CU048_12145 [Beijerinckiaceae bacterium]|nr:hypothetical protein CU048_12145 [Beijerinckiaceae bacterium]